MSQTIITAGDASAGLVQAAGNDGTMVLQTGAAGAKVNALSFAADGTPTLLKVPAVTAVQSMVRLTGANGYGSTNTCIRRFANVVTNQGADITYADSATLGGSFTINTAGVYAISHTSNATPINSASGISLNSTQLSTSIVSINVADILAVGSIPNAANFPFVAACTLYLAVGSIVRAHTDGTAASTGPILFTIVRVA